MKFSEIPYSRPDGDGLLAELSGLAGELRAAKTFEEAVALIDRVQTLVDQFTTIGTVANIRSTIDTRDEFYDGERAYFDNLEPLLNEQDQQVSKALLDSPFRPQLEEKYGALWFLNMEMDQRAFSPEIIPLMQEENSLCAEYQKLYASAQISFEGKLCTIAQLATYKTSPDREIRKRAYIAEGEWFDAHRAEFDGIFDKLVKNRTEQAKKLGFKNFLELGYLRRQRNCYGPQEVANFRRQVVEDLVPIVSKIKAQQAKRIGVDKVMLWDDLFSFPDGNAAPQGTPEEILEAGRKMYTELSPETAEFIKMMIDNDLFDVLAKEGKAPGGYCTFLPDYKTPFIFSNFNGTSSDVDVLTHEAGHAFAFAEGWKAVNTAALRLPTMDGAETHSMSMEFLTAPWHHLFFGEQTPKYELSHAEDSLAFIPYGCMVDHFQQIAYEHPELTPDERNAEWAKLEALYRPYMDSADVPFYSRGSHWQWKMHIYVNPFYYVDYCMAQTIALQIWAESLSDWQAAWNKYLAFVRMGGTKTFVDLVKTSGLLSPLDDGSLKEVCQVAEKWLVAQWDKQ